MIDKTYINQIDMATNKLYDKEKIQIILNDAMSNEPSVFVKSMGTVIGLCKSYEAMMEITQVLLDIAKRHVDAGYHGELSKSTTAERILVNKIYKKLNSK